MTDISTLAVTYSPRVWLARYTGGDGYGPYDYYGPSSVEFHLNNTQPERYYDLTADELFTVTQQPLPTPSTILPFFKGEPVLENGMGPPVYAFVIPNLDVHNTKESALEAIQYPLKPTSVVKIYYMMFFPYNRGKVFAGTAFGSHVGDIEYVSIEFIGGVPDTITVEAHGTETLYPWSSARKFNNTHPVVYCASGSHGTYLEAGTFDYDMIPLLKLEDVTSEGRAWDTWNNVDVITPDQWATRVASSVTSAFKNVRWIVDIYRWGNRSDDCVDNLVCRREDGPIGFLIKLNIGRAEALGLICTGIEPSAACAWPAGIWSKRHVTSNCVYGFTEHADGLCYMQPYFSGRCNCDKTGFGSCSGVDGVCGAGWDDSCHGVCLTSSCYSNCIPTKYTSVLDANKPASAHRVCAVDGQWYPLDQYNEGALGNVDFQFNTGTGAGSKNEFTCSVPN